MVLNSFTLKSGDHCEKEVLGRINVDKNNWKIILNKRNSISCLVKSLITSAVAISNLNIDLSIRKDLQHLGNCAFSLVDVTNMIRERYINN